MAASCARLGNQLEMLKPSTVRALVLVEHPLDLVQPVGARQGEHQENPRLERREVLRGDARVATRVG